MLNFTFNSKTLWVFGRGTQAQTGELTEKFAGKNGKILLHFGGNSIRRSGLYDDVTAQLRARGLRFVELGGVVPNPRLALVREGIRLCREEGVTFILAVGGGSAIDSAKAIAAGVPEENGDIWETFVTRRPIARALPVATVLTIPATGTEMSTNTVITDEESGHKFGYGSTLLRPAFSIVNPELFFTLPPNQIANGVSDMMSHIFERYFSNTPHCDITDGLCESVLRTIIRHAPRVLANPRDYDSWAEIGFAGTIAHNNLLGLGREQDWACHGIEHEISAAYDVAHGAGLATVTPAWMRYILPEKSAVLARFARNVFGVPAGASDAETARAGIAALVAFYRQMKLPVTMRELGVPDDSRFEEMAKKAVLGRSRDGAEIPQGFFRKLYSADIVQILRLAAAGPD